jgi:hypothetical protein
VKWCCIGFENMVGQAGTRGVAVLIDGSRGSVPPDFFIQFRALDTSVPPPFSSDVPISVVMEIGIQFCPWCGALLREFYAESAVQVSHPELKIREG